MSGLSKLRVLWKDKIKWILIPVSLQLQGVNAARSAQFKGKPIVHRFKGTTIEIGERCLLVSTNDVSKLGIRHPVFLRTDGPNAFIRIGNDTGISGGTFCARVGITIGKGVLIGANVTVVDSDFHPLAAEQRRYCSEGIAELPVIIEDNVFIGMNSIVLKGVTIGKNSVVGAGSIVTKNVQPNSIVAGNPAKIIGQLPIHLQK